MEFTTQQELYVKLLPVFRVKTRLIQYNGYSEITNKDIWIYLGMNKWRYSNNLTISEVVNDIITVQLEEVSKYIGGRK